eukprot:m.42312 g.42312  ORF g.42312 m.42312 type:complete len:128 (-) comp14472_c0_seq1:152-535(-)
MVGCDLRGITGQPKCPGVTMNGCDFGGIVNHYDFAKANLSDQSFHGCKITYAKFEGATLTGCDFVEATFASGSSSFHNADITRADFRGAKGLQTIYGLDGKHNDSKQDTGPREGNLKYSITIRARQY